MTVRRCDHEVPPYRCQVSCPVCVGRLLQAAAQQARELADRDRLRGLRPAAVFELCRLLTDAANNVPALPMERRRYLVAVAAAIGTHPDLPERDPTTV